MQGHGRLGSDTLKLLFLVACVWLAGVRYAQSQDVLTYHNDNARTGQNLSETLLTPANVNSAIFGKLFTLSVDGAVDAQPLYVSNVAIAAGLHNVLVVATEHDSVYAFDADSGLSLWRVSMLNPGEGPSDARNCDQVTPEIGVTAAPVIDRSRGPNGAVYLVAMSKDSSGNYHQRLHALDLATGAELFSGPEEIQATYPGTGDNSSGGYVVFDPAQYKERTALLLLNGVVYLSWGSHCDIRPYTGWIMGYDAGTLAQRTVLNVTPNGNEGAVWMSQAGLSADSSGNIYLLDANGVFDTNLNANGFPAQGDYGNAFLRLSTSGGLAVSDYFEMFNQGQENGTDTDLGSGGALVLPDLTDGAGNVWHLAVGAGKDTNLYLVNRDSMGKFNSSQNSIYQQISGALPGGIWSMPAYYNNRLYFGSVGRPIYAFQFSNARLSAGPVAQTSNSFGYPGATPSISANNNNNGIVWAAENSSTGVLHAYDATSLQELYNSNQASGGRDHFGAGNKFITPTIANGKVYVGTTTGVGVFGLSGAIALSPTFSPAPGGYQTGQSVTLSDATPNATIYYTTDGSTPSTASPIYSSPINVNTTTTVKAMATAPGYGNSPVAIGTYTIGPTAAAPTFAPPPGTYGSAQSVTVSDTTPGATINYTTDGSIPTTSSPVYASPVYVGTSLTLKAIATAPGYATSAVASGTYVITAGSGLAGYWTFDEGSGTSAADSSGNGHTATLVNGPAWVSGKIGNAVSADGVNDYVSIPTIDFSSTSAVTLSMWAKRTYSTGGGHVLFENSSNFNNSTTGFGLFPDDSDCQGIMAGVHGNTGYSINCYHQPTSGVWHQLAVVYDKSQAGNSEVKLYIDGVLQTPTRNWYTSNNTNSFGNNPSYVFSRGGTQEYNAGIVDDLRLYNRALSAAEIQQLYNGASLVSIAVSPANPSISKGTVQQFTATGTYSDGSHQDLTNTVTWSSSSTAVATISSAGLATGTGTGTTTIQAALGSINGSTQLTVTPPVLVSISVTPANSSLAMGARLQYTATGYYSDGSQQDLTNSVSWTSSNTGVATISASGLATGVTAGSTSIQGASGSIFGSTTLTVTNPASGPVGYWTLDEGSGTSAADSSGNGHTATLVNGPAWVSGKIGNAVSADGVNDYVSIPAIDFSSTSAVTLSLWTKRTYSTGGGHVLFENSSNYNNSTTGFGLFPDDSDCRGIMAGVRGDIGYSINCYSQPTSGVWHQLAVVYDKSQAGNSEVKLYIDGVLQTPTRNWYTSNNTNNFGNNPSYVFSRGGTQEYNAGIVDDLRLYNRALSAAEIQQLP